LHIGALTPKAWGHKWVRQSNEQRPDLVVVTGDMVTSGTEFHEDIAEVVGALQSRDGVVVSMGNHDYFGDGEPLVSHLRQRHVRVLRNEGLLLRRDTGEIFLSAIDDTWTRRADLGKALAQRPSGMPTVLLAHDPGAFPAARGQDVDLVLSGHTHGGQIAMPFLGRWLSLSHLVHKFHIGIYRDGRSTLFVHPGLGTTGPPMRLGVAPAIVLLRLRPA
jgi:predicted MPP superfamily phosphohydrolase